MGQVAEEEQSVEDQAAEEAALEQAYLGNDVEEAPEPEFTPEVEEPKAPEAQANPEPQAEPELTLNDLKAMIESERTEKQKVTDKLFGKIGELQQKIDSARVQATGLSPKARERLQADFPELAEMLFDGEPEQQAPVQTQPRQEATQPEVTPEQEAEAKELLAYDHADWEDVVVSDGFLDWMDTLPPAVKNRLETTFDPAFVSDKLTRYKASVAANEQKSEREIKKKTERESRLDSAIVPNGTPRGSNSNMSDDDEESAMLSAFTKRR